MFLDRALETKTIEKERFIFSALFTVCWGEVLPEWVWVIGHITVFIIYKLLNRVGFLLSKIPNVGASEKERKFLYTTENDVPYGSLK